MERIAIVLGSILTLLILAGEEVDAQSKCTALKIKFAAKAAFLKAKCEFKAVKKGIVVDPECGAKAQAFLTKKWEKAEAKNDCLTVGDQSAAEAEIDDFVHTLVTALVPLCGNDSQETGEECDGSDDAVCPGLCASDCTCPNPDEPVCCEDVPAGPGLYCQGGYTATECVGLGGTVGPAGSACESPITSSCAIPGGGDCCAFPGSCVAADDITCFAGGGTYFEGQTCTASGDCAAP